MNDMKLCFAFACATVVLAGCADAGSDGQSGSGAPDATAATEASAASPFVADVSTKPTATDPRPTDPMADAAPVDLDELVGTDNVSNAMNCVVHLGQLGPRARVDPGLAELASASWRAWLVTEMSENEANQLIGSNVNMLSSTPEAARDVAAQWCIDNAPA